MTDLETQDGDNSLIRSSCSPISKRPRHEYHISHLRKPSQTFKFGNIDFEETLNSKPKEDTNQGQETQLSLVNQKNIKKGNKEEEKEGNGNQMKMIGGRKRIMA